MATPDEIARELRIVGAISSIPHILDIVREMTGMRFAAVARVTADRWMACAASDDLDFGLTPGGELPVKATIRDEVAAAGRPVAFDRAPADPDRPLPHMPTIDRVESYISVPIRLADGSLYGTLCAIDTEEHSVSASETVRLFEQFAVLIGYQIDAQMSLEDAKLDLETAEAALEDERDEGQLREQFVAVLGHDLRDPLAALGAGVRMLKRHDLPDESAKLVTMMGRTVQRMAGVIDNVLDLARARVGGGIPIELQPIEPAEVLSGLVDELAIGHPEVEIAVDCDVTGPLAMDASRVGRALANLIGNAVRHGTPGRPVRLAAKAQDGVLAFSVENHGPQVPAALAEGRFEPFLRRPEGEPASGAAHRGLGLGLFITSEIAKAHGGSLRLEPLAHGTRAVLSIPLTEQARSAAASRPAPAG